MPCIIGRWSDGSIHQLFLKGLELRPLSMRDDNGKVEHLVLESLLLVSSNATGIEIWLGMVGIRL